MQPINFLLKLQKEFIAVLQGVSKIMVQTLAEYSGGENMNPMLKKNISS